MRGIESRASQNQPNGSSVEAWERRLTQEVFMGPMANLPINELCYRAFSSGLLPVDGDGKFLFLTELAEVMSSAYPNGQAPKPLEDLDFKEIARKFSRQPERIEIIARLMAEFSLIPKKEGKEVRQGGEEK